MISSSLVNSWLTPWTMLLTSERTRPCSARFSRSSSGRSTMISAPSWRTEMSPGRRRSRVPLGPFTVSSRPEMVISTPLGTGTGERPTRDIATASPHEAQDLATDVAGPCFAVGHQALAGRHDGHAQAAEHPGDLRGVGVHPETRLRDAAQPGDRAVALGRVLHRDVERLARPRRVVRHREVLDVALLA